MTTTRHGVGYSHRLSESVLEERWDEVGRLASSHLIRISFEDPDALPAAFAALPRDWLRQHPRHVLLRSILESLGKPFTVGDHDDYELFVEWLERQALPLARDLICKHLGPLQYAKALGNLTDADAEVESVRRVIRETTEYTDFEDILPSVFIPIGATKLLLDDVPSAIALFTEAIRWSAIARDHPAEPHARNYLALAHAVDGDYAGAQDSAAAGIGIRTGAPGSFAHVYESSGLLVPPLLSLGALDEQSNSRELARIDQAVEETEFWALSAHLHARHALYWGDEAAAAEALERLLVSNSALSGAGSLAGSMLRADLSDLYQSLGVFAPAEWALDGILGKQSHPMVRTSWLRLSALRGEHHAVLDDIRHLIQSRDPSELPVAAWAVIRANAAHAAGHHALSAQYVRRAAAVIVRRGAFDALTEASPEILQQLLTILGERRAPIPQPYHVPVLPALTQQELRILLSLTSETSLRKISADLYLSVNTVKTHLRNLYRKLDVQSREQAILVGRAHRLVP